MIVIKSMFCYFIHYFHTVGQLYKSIMQQINEFRFSVQWTAVRVLLHVFVIIVIFIFIID